MKIFLIFDINPSVCVLCVKSLQSCPTLCDPVDHHPLSIGFSRQEHWSGLSCPPPGDLPNPGVEAMSLLSPALAGRLFTTRATWGAHESLCCGC